MRIFFFFFFSFYVRICCRRHILFEEMGFHVWHHHDHLSVFWMSFVLRKQKNNLFTIFCLQLEILSPSVPGTIFLSPPTDRFSVFSPIIYESWFIMHSQVTERWMQWFTDRWYSPGKYLVGPSNKGIEWWRSKLELRLWWEKKEMCMRLDLTDWFFWGLWYSLHNPLWGIE